MLNCPISTSRTKVFILTSPQPHGAQAPQRFSQSPLSSPRDHWPRASLSNNAFFSLRSLFLPKQRGDADIDFAKLYSLQSMLETILESHLEHSRHWKKHIKKNLKRALSSKELHTDMDLITHVIEQLRIKYAKHLPSSIELLHDLCSIYPSLVPENAMPSAFVSVAYGIYSPASSPDPLSSASFSFSASLRSSWASSLDSIEDDAF